MDTKFKKIINDKLLVKNLSQSSISLYLRNLEKLNNNKPLLNLKFLEKVEDIKKIIDTYKPNTQRSFYISIVSILGTFKDTNKKIESLYNKYYDLMMNINKSLKEVKTEEKTETQNKNWMTWDEIIKKKEDLYIIIKEYGPKINENEYNNVLNWVIISLYTSIAPRRNLDYQKCLIVKKYINGLNKDFNYLSLDDTTFYFNKYKTSKKENGVNIKYDDEFKKVLDIYWKYHPLYKKLKKSNNIYFLVNFNGEPLLKINDITKRLNKVMGSKVGSSMLRHIYLSTKYGNILKEQQKDSEQMSHNLQTQKDYIKTGNGPIVVSFN